MVQAVVTPHNQALFWNLSFNVGPGQPNQADDVEFVRFGYFLMKDNPKALTGQFVTLKPILQKVTPTGPRCSRRAIRARKPVAGPDVPVVGASEGQQLQPWPI